jgi:glutamate-1-semialdehyde 2,1-aminomutase
MSAIHLARGATGRDLIIKIEGSYDGHHDAVMVSCYPELDELGPRESPTPVPFGEGYPQAVVELTVPIPFNDADILEATLNKHEGKIAGLIIEPAMMNINIIPPKEGYLERVRELCTDHGVQLIFDEVKTGATISYGGATRRFGVEPDIICLAKAICGGYPGGAIGMTAELGEVIASDRVHQIGTFNGNPLVMAAAEATLTKVLTPDVYDKLEATNDDLMSRCQDVIDRYGLPAYTQGLGAKGCVIFAPEPIFEYRDYLTKVDAELATLAWLYHMNHGIFMTPGVEEEWTLSIAHEQEHIDRYVAAFEAFATDVSGS